MFDFIGNRRYGYAFSAVVTVVSLIFILMTLIPNAGLGLQFSIAYTGGTVWEVHFAEGAPTPAEVRGVLEEQGLPNSDVAITGSQDREFVLIRTEALTLIEPGAGPPDEAAGGEADEADVAPTEAAASAAVATAAPASEGGPTIAPDAAANGVAEAGLPGLYPGATTRTGSGDAAPGPRLPGVYPGTSAAAPPAGPAGDRRLPGIYPGSGEAPEATPVERPVAGVPTEGRFGEVATALQERFGPIDEVRQQNSVGPVVSNELIQQTFLLIIFASGAIMLYITYRFRDFRMGATAIVALIHDVIATVGLFAVVGTLLGLQVDALFVTAMLTVIGFSVHDTIVVFDRIRENRQRYLGERLGDIANHSLMQTLGRSITTSLTLLVTLLALLVLGPDSIRSFMLVLLIGVSAGVYSSILVATPLLVDWHAYDERRKGRRVTQPSTA